MNANTHVVILRKLENKFTMDATDEIMKNFISETILKLITLFQPHDLQNAIQSSGHQHLRSWIITLLKLETDKIIQSQYGSFRDSTILLDFRGRLFRFHNVFKSYLTELNDNS